MKEELLSHGNRFSFFQVMRLLRRLGHGSGQSRIRIRPDLNLAFPTSDVRRVQSDGDSYTVTANFLGLYGAASPLPTFYSEDLAAEAAADSSTTRDFLDIVNHLLFDLFHQCSLKYRLCHNLVELEHRQYEQRLLCLVGLGDLSSERKLLEPGILLSSLPLLVMTQRSAAGLALFLANALGAPVEVVQCEARRVPVPTEQRLQLGITACTIGSDAVLGCEVPDLNGTFRIRIGPLDRESFKSFLPGGAASEELNALVDLYLDQPLEWQVELIHRQEDLPAACLGGGEGAALGWNSWLAPGGELTRASVTLSSYSDQATQPERPEQDASPVRSQCITMA